MKNGTAAAVAAAVNDGKAALGGAPGGVFLVDEYGRVLVPSSGGAAGGVAVVGECTGPMCFENPFDGGDFDLYDDTRLRGGDVWDRPYVGVQYQLSKQDELYFWDESFAGALKLTPPGQDSGLVEKLRRIRPYGAVRFLLGPGGVAITKVQTGAYSWEPRYVGRLDLRTWFPKEVLE
jgi:hypothetical protein